MSSLGGQWRIIRHYLSLSNLNSEVEKLVQKIKPATPEQWESKCTIIFKNNYKNAKIINLYVIINYFLYCICILYINSICTQSNNL